jgi:hypothetical protein
MLSNFLIEPIKAERLDSAGKRRATFLGSERMNGRAGAPADDAVEGFKRN